jgi:hypothetical protein
MLVNAFDIAKDLDREGKFPGHVCYGTSPLLVRAANMLRQQQAEIEALKAELRLIDELVTGKAQNK